MSNVQINIKTPPQLPQATAAALADLMLLWQGSELKNISFQDFVASLISADGGNFLVIGSDGKLTSAIPANLTYFASTAASDIPNYFTLVTNIADPLYDEPAVPVGTGTITGTGQLVGQLAGQPGVFVGNPGVINITTAGEIRRTSGSGSAEFYFEVYKRDANGAETLLGTSNKTLPVTNAQFAQFSADCLLNNGVFTASDRLVLKFYADRVGSGSNPNYEFLFGGANPVSTRFPVAASLLSPTGKIRRHNFANPFSYCGFANFGASETSPTWTITRIEVLSNGATITGVATGAWTNRVNLIYI